MSNQVYSGKLFSWSRNVGVSEASTLAFPVGESPASIDVRSHRTGRVLSFKHVKTCSRGDDGSYYLYASPGGIVLRIFED